MRIARFRGVGFTGRKKSSAGTLPVRFLRLMPWVETLNYQKNAQAECLCY